MACPAPCGRFLSLKELLMETPSPIRTIIALTICLFVMAAVAHADRHHQIGHVVIIFMENRTPDNLFQDPNLIANGADIASSGMNSQGQNIPLTAIPLANNYDLSHSHGAFVAEYDNGLMNGADK